jgi:hypothetical protein
MNTKKTDVALDQDGPAHPEPDYPHSKVLDARDLTAPPRFEIKAPEGAPNVLVSKSSVLLAPSGDCSNIAHTKGEV